MQKTKSYIGLIIILALLFASANLAAPSTAHAAVQATFYVSPNGNDSNAGTLAAPFLTLNKARQAADAINASMTGDIIINFRGGNYPFTAPVTFGVGDSGTNGFKIYYQAYLSEIPVFNAGVPVKGWSLVSGSIYQASLPSRSTKLRTLYVNDQRAVMARGPVITPQGGYGTFTVAGTESWALNSGSTYTGIQFPSASLGLYANAGDAELVNQVGFSFHVIGLSSIITNGANRVAQLQQPMGAIALSEPQAWGMAFYQLNNSPSNNFYVQNAYELLDEPGEFYFNKSTHILYYYKRTTDNMDTAEVYAPLSEGMLRLAGTSTSSRVSNLVFQGLTFAHDHWSLMNVAGSVGSTTVQGNVLYDKFYSGGNWHTAKYANTDTMPAAVQTSNASSIQFLGNTFQHLGAGAIAYGNDTVSSTIIGNKFSDISGSAISVGDARNTYIGDGDIPIAQEGVPTTITVKNNYINQASVEFLQTVPIIASYANGLNIEHNLIVNSPYTGISVGWGWNYFAGYEPGVTATNVAQNNKINYNSVISSMKLMHDGAAIYTIGAQPGSQIKGNYIRDAGGVSYGNAIYTDQASSGFEIANNVAEQYNGAWWTVWGSDAHVSNITVHDNYVQHADGTEGNYATASTKTNTNVEVAAPPWSGTAQTLINASGLEPAYANLLQSPPLKYEAEFAALSSGAAVNTDHINYTGHGFVEGYTTAGATTTFSVNVPTAGAYNVILKYANAQNNPSTVSIYVNGTKIKQTSLPLLANWDTWGTKGEQLNLNAGTNTIAYKYDTGDNGWINLDNITIPVYEAEQAVMLKRATAYTDTAASHSAGAAQLDLIGDGLQFTNVPASSQITIRYASPNSGTYGLYVNGVRTSISFAGNGVWSGAYSSKTVNIAIPAGATVKLQHDSGDSSWNLDYVIFNNTIITTVIEAESGTKIGRAINNADAAASGGAMVAQLDLVGDGVQFTTGAAASQITIRYSSPNSGNYGLYINGVRTTFSFVGNGVWFGAYVDKIIPIAIPAGATVKLQNAAGDSGLNVDKITLQ